MHCIEEIREHTRDTANKKSSLHTSQTAPPLDRLLVHHSITPSIKFSGSYLYTRLERGTVRVKCPQSRAHPGESNAVGKSAIDLNPIREGGGECRDTPGQFLLQNQE